MPTSFEELADSYSCIFFDAFGVLKSSAGLFPGVMEILDELQNRGKQVFIVTNDASRSPHRMAEGYALDGRPIVPLDHIISSGLLAQDYLKNKVRSGYVAYLGKESSSYYIVKAGLYPIPLKDISTDDHNPKCIVLLDDEGFDWFSEINHAVNMIREHNIPVIVANTDVTYPSTPTSFNIAVGGLARLLEAATGRGFIHFGKPDPMIFSKAFHLALEKDPKLTKGDVLMVGDTLATDIVGGNKYGIDTALVLSGTTTEAVHRGLIQTTGIVPTYVCTSILT
jgi:HAD superfamily hydrolase (TIGR01450 family)